MTNQGMDAERVESAARDLKSRAADIDALVRRVDGIVRTARGVWVGPVAERFVGQWWPAQRVTLVTASSHVAGLGDSLTKNVNEQRQASRAINSPSGIATKANLGAIGGPAIQSAADRYLLTRAGGEDGVRIQGVLGADGILRYVVYIDGTNSSWVGDHSITENVAELGVATQTYWNILNKMAAEIHPPGSQVMIAGYSQGGILAQRLASSKLFNVTDVITYGSPYYDAGDPVHGYNIVRVQDDADAIPLTGVANKVHDSVTNPVLGLIDKAVTAWQSITGNDAGAVQHEMDRINNGRDITYTTDAGTAREWSGPVYIGTHGVKQTYIDGGNQYEVQAAATPDGRAVLESQARYTGQVVRDSDAGVRVNYDYIDADGQQRGDSTSVA